MTSIATRWVVLASGCAAPLMATVWDNFSAAELIAAGLGVATWTIVMIAFHTWRLVHGAYGETTRLVASATLLMVLQAIVWAVAPREILWLCYAPAVVPTGRFVLAPFEVVDAWAAPYVLTLACGGQVFAGVLGLSWLLERIQRRS